MKGREVADGDRSCAKADRNVLSISFALPYSGVDHAGGELLLHHYRVLAARCRRLDAFAIEFESNKNASSRQEDLGFDNYRTSMISFPRWRKTFLGKTAARIWSVTAPVLPDLGVCTSFYHSKSLREAIRQADIVELQWFEYFAFARLVKRENPNARIVGFVHDIPSQRIERSLVRLPKPFRNLYLDYVVWLERILIEGLDCVTVLSNKDADLVRNRTAWVETYVLDPPLNHDESDVASGEASPLDRMAASADVAFGFVGALQRRENDDAARWLLSAIWPSVLNRCPTARLYIIGSTPSSELREAAAAFADSVEVTGYVEDIGKYYNLFNTVIIPLRYGAGVKFKTISAVLAGKNIVATPVAVEGVLADEHFFCVSDDPDKLAFAMVQLVTDPASGHLISEQARLEAGSRYSLDSYVRAVEVIYGFGKRR
jgi:glycosyltransferase involved in cell wall biosynthesis